jgi:hypothetical protein
MPSKNKKIKIKMAIIFQKMIQILLEVRFIAKSPINKDPMKWNNAPMKLDVLLHLMISNSKKRK